MKETTAAVISLGSKSSLMTVEAMKKYFTQVHHYNLRYIEVNIGKKEAEILYKGKPMPDYDCIYAKGSFRYAPLLHSFTVIMGLKKTYMPLTAEAFSVGHDKTLTQLKLQQHKLPMPKTYITSSANAAKEIFNKINYPIIMKFPQGTQGKGVLIAESKESATSMMDALQVLNQPFVIQEFVDTEGVDIRAFVVGDRVVAAMKRKAELGETRANIHRGGRGEACELDARTKKLAVQAGKAVGAEICGVDLLESVNGPLVIEVNVSPGIQGITAVTKIDIADKIAKFLHKKAQLSGESTTAEKKTKVFEELGIDTADKEIVTSLDFRGERILLPPLVTKVAKFTDKDEVVFRVGKKYLEIKSMDVEEK